MRHDAVPLRIDPDNPLDFGRPERPFSPQARAVGIDLLKPEDFPTLKRFGLACTMTSSHPLANGLCDPKFHGACLEAIQNAVKHAGPQAR